MFLYPVTLKRDQDGGLIATFKDIPEAITQGETEHEALAAAKDALETPSISILKTIAQCCPPKPGPDKLLNCPPPLRQNSAPQRRSSNRCAPRNWRGE